MFAGCENILQHAPQQTLLLINLSALCFESNPVQPPEKHSAVSGAWLCFEGNGLLPSQSTARLCCKNTSSQCSTLQLHTLVKANTVNIGLNSSCSSVLFCLWLSFSPLRACPFIMLGHEKVTFIKQGQSRSWPQVRNE